MKRLNFGVWVLLLAANAAFAQAPATPPAPVATQKPAVPGSKIGIIDMRRAITESEPGKAASSDYAKAMATESALLDKLNKEVAELSEKLKTAKTDAEKNELGRQLDAKGREGQRAQDDAQRKSEELQDKLLPPIAVLVNKALDTYAVENGLAVVLDPTTEPNNIVHFNMASDVTNEIIRRVDAEYAKTGKPAGASPAAK